MSSSASRAWPPLRLQIHGTKYDQTCSYDNTPGAYFQSCLQKFAVMFFPERKDLLKSVAPAGFP